MTSNHPSLQCHSRLWRRSWRLLATIEVSKSTIYQKSSRTNADLMVDTIITINIIADITIIYNYYYYYYNGCTILEPIERTLPGRDHAPTSNSNNNNESTTELTSPSRENIQRCNKTIDISITY